MRRIILSSVACPALSYFPHLKNGTIKKIEQELYVVFFFTLFVWNISHSRKKWDMKIVQRSSYKVPIFFSDFNETWIFSTKFKKKTQMLNVMKIRLLGPELFHADGQTWRNWYSLFAILRTFLKTVVMLTGFRFELGASRIQIKLVTALVAWDVC